MLYHQKVSEESSGSQQSAEQLFVILFVIQVCENKLWSPKSVHHCLLKTLFQASDFLKDNFEAQLTLSMKD